MTPPSRADPDLPRILRDYGILRYRGGLYRIPDPTRPDDTTAALHYTPYYRTLCGDKTAQPRPGGLSHPTTTTGYSDGLYLSHFVRTRPSPRPHEALLGVPPSPSRQTSDTVPGMDSTTYRIERRTRSALSSTHTVPPPPRRDPDFAAVRRRSFWVPLLCSPAGSTVAQFPGRHGAVPSDGAKVQKYGAAGTILYCTR